MIVDDNHHLVTRHMPNKFIASMNGMDGNLTQEQIKM